MADEPAHGYDLKRVHDHLFRQARPLRTGHVYATLARLVRDGLAAPLADEPGLGPDRKRYAITASGRASLAEWLETPEEPAAFVESELHAKVVFSLRRGIDPAPLVRAQRALHLGRMRALVRTRAEAGVVEALATDHAIFQLEADLRWLDHVEGRLDALRKEVAR
jgi:DNA-binding PadR family transcriptional regulator